MLVDKIINHGISMLSYISKEKENEKDKCLNIHTLSFVRKFKGPTFNGQIPFGAMDQAKGMI